MTDEARGRLGAGVTPGQPDSSGSPPDAAPVEAGSGGDAAPKGPGSGRDAGALDGRSRLAKRVKALREQLLDRLGAAARDRLIRQHVEALVAATLDRERLAARSQARGGWTRRQAQEFRARGREIRRLEQRLALATPPVAPADDPAPAAPPDLQRLSNLEFGLFAALLARARGETEVVAIPEDLRCLFTAPPCPICTATARPATPPPGGVASALGAPSEAIVPLADVEAVPAPEAPPAASPARPEPSTEPTRIPWPKANVADSLTGTAGAPNPWPRWR